MRGNALVLNRGNELVAPSGKRCHEYGFVRLVPQNLADSEDVLLYDFGIDVRIRPQRFENFVLSDQPIGMLNQVTEYIEGFWRQRNTLSPAPQTVVDSVKPKCVESLHAFQGVVPAPRGPGPEVMHGILRQTSSALTIARAKPAPKSDRIVTGRSRRDTHVLIVFASPPTPVGQEFRLAFSSQRTKRP